MTDQELLSLFLPLISYDGETGDFTWIVSRGRARAGAVARCAAKDGYIRIRIFGQTYAAHRLAWLFTHGRWPSLQIDHINGVKADNRITNLRDVSHGVNQRNRHHPCGNNPYINVYQIPCGRFGAFIRFNNKAKWIGSFVTAEEANSAVLQRKAELMQH